MNLIILLVYGAIILAVLLMCGIKSESNSTFAQQLGVEKIGTKEIGGFLLLLAVSFLIGRVILYVTFEKDIFYDLTYRDLLFPIIVSSLIVVVRAKVIDLLKKGVNKKAIKGDIWLASLLFALLFVAGIMVVRYTITLNSWSFFCMVEDIFVVSLAIALLVMIAKMKNRTAV